jgi:nucleoside-diphosphate-sugar epimerase
MRVLVVGGSGYVAGLMMPELARRHAVRVLDLRPPAAVVAGVDYRTGDATDFEALCRAAEGVDTVLHCAMATDWQTPAGFVEAFAVHVASVHLTLRAAHETGITHAVHISSMSVFRDLENRRLDESDPTDATDLYGLTKRLGEQVCAAAVAEWGLSVNVLRLTWPTPDDVWPLWGIRGEPPFQRYAGDGRPIEATAASDLARAALAALEYRDGLQIFTISGDRSAALWSTAKARELLGWEPEFPPASHGA